MANQSPDRRTALAMMAKAAAASQFPGFARWAFAGQEHHHSDREPAHERPATYTPLFFEPAEYQTIDVLTELILPKDETPGAHEAGVSEFIDFMAAHGEQELQPLRSGLVWLSQAAHKAHGTEFVALTRDEQTALLAPQAYRAHAAQGDPEGQQFFVLIRRYTVMGYYTSRLGLQELNYPGLRFYAQSPACPHTNDPEHKHLPPPRF